MRGWLHPEGSHPQSIYWLRRGIVLILIALVVGGIVWTFSWRQRAVPHAYTTQRLTPATTPATAAAPTSSPAPPTATAPSSPSPRGPVACDPKALRLTLSGPTSLKAGDSATFNTSIINTSSVTCDVVTTANSYVLIITSGTDEIWSSKDCDQWLPAKAGSLAPQKDLTWSVVWAGKRSASGCKLVDPALRPGTYVATVTYQTATSQRLVLTLT